MLVNREFSPDIAQALQKIDEKLLRNLLKGHNLIKKQQRQISRQQLKSALEYLRSANPFNDIKDPVAWQKSQRNDRELPR